MLPALVLLLPVMAAAQAAPADWTIIRDAKGVCQLAVPPDWVPLTSSAGAAVLRDPTTAIAVVTSQPGQEFQPLTSASLRTMGVPKEKVFENSAARVFYQHRTAESRGDSNAFSSSVPAKGGTCSCHITAQPLVTEEIARKIILTLSPVAAKT